jgi:hypothetical protein
MLYKLNYNESMTKEGLRYSRENFDTVEKELEETKASISGEMSDEDLVASIGQKKELGKAREDLIDQTHEEALQENADFDRQAENEESAAEGELAQETQEQAGALQENVQNVIEKIDNLPEQVTLSEKVREKIDKIKDKYWDINAKIATWTMGGTGAATVGAMGYGAHTIITDPSSVADMEQFFYGGLKTMVGVPLLGAAIGSTIYLGSKLMQKAEQWKAKRDITKEARA